MVRKEGSIEAPPQRNKDANSNKIESDLSKFLLADGFVPTYFDHKKLASIYEDSITWWDRVHKDCFFGDYREGSMTQVRFPRDDNGKYNFKEKYHNKSILLMIKYNKQGRFCLCVGIVGRGNSPEGKRI